MERECDASGRPPTLGHLLLRPGIRPGTGRPASDGHRGADQTRCRRASCPAWLRRPLGTQGHARSGLAGTVAAHPPARPSAGTGPQVITSQPALTMTASTTHEFRPPITVSNSLATRIEQGAEACDLRLPEFRLGDQQAAPGEARTLEQTSPLGAVCAKSKAYHSRRSNRGGNVSLIALCRCHALPLPAGRFSGPRLGRRVGAKHPSIDCRHCPWPQPVRDRDQSAEPPRSRTIRALEPVVSSHRQKPRPGPRAVRLRGSARPRHVRANVQARALAWQRSVHRPGQSATALRQGAWPVHERGQASSARSPRTCPVRQQPARGKL